MQPDTEKSESEGFGLQYVDVMCCPKCRGSIAHRDTGFECLDCRQDYPAEDHIPLLFWQHEWDTKTREDVTKEIKSFYEENPFPNYDDFDSVGTLLEKARKGVFAKLLDEQIPFGARVIEVGCGTGQLTNFLSVANRKVVGADLCLNSLRMAHEFKAKNHLQRASFCQMNLFQPCFKPESFHVVISNGVLHHTADPFLAFKTISTLVKPKGYILIGLYHKYGRLLTDLRRFLFRATGDKLKGMDRRLVDGKISLAKRDAWFMDQYKNPHESKHTISEVLGWVDAVGFRFVKSIPKTVLFSRFSATEPLFVPEKPGSWLERFLVEFGMTFTGSQEGGFFIVIAQKP